MKNKQLLLTLCAAVLMALQPMAYAFWSAVKTVHQDMTSRALNQSIYAFQTPALGSVSYAFSSTAISAINQAHTIADGDPYDPRDHFDSEQLQQGYQLLITHRQALMGELQKSSPKQSVAWTILGLALHQIQDFYAHSSYVEHTGGTGGIIDFGAATTMAALSANPNGKTPAVIQAASAIGSVCASDMVTLTAPSTHQVTTGYYPPNSPGTGKCQHGAISGSFKGSVAVANCKDTLFSASVTKDGINKDHPCVTSDLDKQNHATAKTLAEKETEAFVQSIAMDLSAAGNGKGFCALLGLSPDSAPCSVTSSPPGSGTTTFVNWALDNAAQFTFGPVDPCDGQSHYIASGPLAGGGATNQCRFGPYGLNNDSSLQFTGVTSDGYNIIQLSTGTLAYSSLNLAPPGSTVAPGQALKSPTYTYALNSTSTVVNNDFGYFGEVTYLTGQNVPGISPPYPDWPTLSTFGYITVDHGTNPGSVSFYLYTVARPDAASQPALATIADIYLQGSFDFQVGDLLVVPDTLSHGTHHVTGTFRISVGSCQMSFDQKSMTCPFVH